MKRTGTADLFSLTPKEAHELVERVPIGSVVTPQWRTTNGRRRGPYWYAYVVGRGQVYVGQIDAWERLQRAWSMVGAEIAELEAQAEAVRRRAAPVEAKLAELRRRVVKARTTRGTKRAPRTVAVRVAGIVK